ncbi:enoyl-CoA hydratase/isomerase family protein, partial [Vibrio parahaemolyticus EKP-028]
RLLAKDGRNA